MWPTSPVSFLNGLSDVSVVIILDDGLTDRSEALLLEEVLSAFFDLLIVLNLFKFYIFKTFFFKFKPGDLIFFCVVSRCYSNSSILK